MGTTIHQEPSLMLCHTYEKKTTHRKTLKWFWWQLVFVL